MRAPPTATLAPRRQSHQKPRRTWSKGCFITRSCEPGVTVQYCPWIHNKPGGSGSLRTGRGASHTRPSPPRSSEDEFPQPWPLGSNEFVPRSLRPVWARPVTVIQRRPSPEPELLAAWCLPAQLCVLNGGRKEVTIGVGGGGESGGGRGAWLCRASACGAPRIAVQSGQVHVLCPDPSCLPEGASSHVSVFFTSTPRLHHDYADGDRTAAAWLYGPRG